MLRFEVEDRRSLKNPIPMEIRPRPLVYHGTSLSFANSIEKYGFDSSRIPYSMRDVLTVNKAYETFGWHGIGPASRGGYIVIGTFTVGPGNLHVRNKRLGFSYHYEYARDYACDAGGETISNLLTALDDFERFACEPSLRRDHIAALKASESVREIRLAAKPRHANLLRNCMDDRLVESWWRNLEPIRSRYEHLRVGHHPVVYAVRGEPDFFKRPAAPGESDLWAQRAIPTEYIFARIDFPNGAEHVFWSSTDQEELPF